jgi:hypothetical protein
MSKGRTTGRTRDRWRAIRDAQTPAVVVEAGK